jgi:hypothetical protein
VHLISLPVAFAVLLWLDSGLWFFYDEWAFLAVRGEGGRPLGLFAPYNEHWSTIPLLIYRGLYNVVGLHTYIPYLVVLLLAHVVLAHLLFRLIRRVGVDPWIATAATLVFLFLGSGANDLTWAFQMGYILPLVIGGYGLLLVDHEGPGIRRDLLYWPVAVLALMCSGVAVALVAAAAITALLRRGWIPALRVASVPTVVYIAWFILIGHTAQVTYPTTSELLQIPQFVWIGLTTAVDNTLGWPGAGAVAVLGLSVFLAMQGTAARRRGAIAVAMALGAVVFFVTTGIERISMGLNEATASRYPYVAIALLLPAAVWAVDSLARRLNGGRILVVCLSAVVAVNGLGGLMGYAQGSAGLEDTDKYQLLAAAHLIVSGAPLLVNDDAQPDPAIAPGLTLGELRSMVRDGAVPLSTPVPPDAVLRATLQLQMAVTPTPSFEPGTSPTIVAAQGVSRESTGRCTVVTWYSDSSTLTLSFTSAGWIAITADANGTLSVSLAATNNASTATAPRSFPVAAGSTSYLELAVGGMTAVISLPPGPSLICGAA